MTVVLAAALVLAVFVAVALGLALSRARADLARVSRSPGQGATTADGPSPPTLTGPAQSVAGEDGADTPAESQADTAAADTAAGEEAAGPPHAAGVAATLWLLESSRLERLWRLGAPGMAPPAPADSYADGLVRALALELDMLRDDVGVPGRMRLSLTEDLDEVTALLVLRTIQELLAGLARVVDEVDITAGVGEHAVEVVVTYAADPSDTGSAEWARERAADLGRHLEPVRGEVRSEASAVTVRLPR